MTDRFSRTEMLLGSDAMDKLRNARVAVFGLGGVGGYIVEALARSGVGTLDIIDNARSLRLRELWECPKRKRQKCASCR